MIEAQFHERINHKVRIVTDIDAMFGEQIPIDTIFAFTTNDNKTLAIRITNK